MGGTATTTKDTDSPTLATTEDGEGPRRGEHVDDLGGVLPLRLRLVTLSFLQLFIQLALIRWLGAQVVYMSYYSNFVLLASFLGFGLGFLWAGTRKLNLYHYTPVLLGALVLVVYQFQVGLNYTTSDIVFFQTMEPDSVLPRWAVLLILFVAVAIVAAALGEGVARTFSRFKPLEAYKLDLIGSILGIAGFGVLSFLGARPVVWGLVAAAGFLLTLPLGTRARTGSTANGDGSTAEATGANAATLSLLALLKRPQRATATSVFALVGVALFMTPFVAEAADDDVIWSPYYRITHQPAAYCDLGDTDIDDIVDLGVDRAELAAVVDAADPTQVVDASSLTIGDVNCGHLDELDENLASQLGVTGDDRGVDAEVNQSPHWSQIDPDANPLYERVYERVTESGAADDVLVIGAGSGNDVTFALNEGADHVDAVEIDPRLIELAEDNHLDEPYDDPRVSTHIDDGRAFLERSGGSWDRILLALPDSLALVQGQSAVRLESYLFTAEAVEAASEHLEPDGVFAMYNWYREDWLVDRYANTLAEVFDAPPCVSRFGGDSLSVLVASNDPAALDCPADEVWDRDTVSAEYEARGEELPSPVVDDRPFPYVRDNGIPFARDLPISFLQDRGIPTDYLLTGAGALIISLLAIVAILGPTKQLRSSLRYLDLFFMGVAFLLLETKNVTQFALLFGTTWFVNALVFTGVLLSILTAVAVSRRITFKRPARLYIVLLAALALAYVVPEHALLELAVVPRFLVAVTLAFFPVFTANLVFAQRFKESASSTVAFGANLLGAMVGGLLEYASIMVGFNGLLVVAAIVYGLAFLSGRKHLAPTLTSA